MKRKSIGLLCLLMVSSFVLSGCGGSETPLVENENEKNEQNQEKGSSETQLIKASDESKVPATAKNRKDTLIVGTQDPKGTFNPLYADNSYDTAATNLIFEGLVTYDAKGTPMPNIAESWEISEDAKTYTFKIKPGVKFSNGEELKAKDVEFTYTSLCDPSYDGVRTDAVDKLVGFEDYRSGSANKVQGIKVIDDYTISFTLTEIKAPAIYDFACGIMPKSLYGFEKGNIQKLKDKFLEPIGSGSYKFAEFKPGQYVKFEKNKEYFKGEPKIQNIIMKVTNSKTTIQELQAGNIDIDGVTPNKQNIDMIKSAGFLDIQLYNDNGYGYIGFNLRNPKFEDKKVRQALTYGLDRKGFVENYYQGYGELINTHGSSASWSSPDESKLNKYEYNPDKANKLLDEAGWKMNESTKIREKDGVPLEISWMTYTDSKYVDNLIPIVKENWAKIGVKVTPELMEFSTLSEKVKGKREFEIFNMAWSLGIDPDPSWIFSKTQDVSGGFNAVGWHPEKSEDLMQKALQTVDQKEREKIYQEWYELINEEAPYIFLATNKAATVVNSRVKGLEVSPHLGWTAQAYKLELTE